MLKGLFIKNYALINSLEINFKKNFIIITGETGAGKSIIMGALSLILGNRADRSALFDQKEKCIIEGYFDISNYKLKTLFDNADIDYDDNTTIRREITPAGKNRIFINDTPVNLAVLKEIGDNLIDIHSQNSILEINKASFQLSVVDGFAGNKNLLLEYSEKYYKYQILCKELKDLQLKEAEFRKESDYLNFIFNELEDANLQVDEQDKLESESKLLNHSEEIKTSLFSAENLLLNQDENILYKLKEVNSLIEKISIYDKSYKEITGRLEANYIDLKDIGDELSLLNEKVTYSPERIVEIDERLNIIYRLQNKHQAASIEDLINIKTEIDKKLQNSTSLAVKIANMEQEKELLYEDLNKLSLQLKEKRKHCLIDIETLVVEKLNLLQMNNAQFKIELKDLDELHETGTDSVVFLFSANRGSAMQAINKVASGGELSRLMLSLKAVVSTNLSLPTVVFDEIDTGVSGYIASRLGNIMKEMSENMQVFAITHLPQIASLGFEHFKVFKEEKENKSYSYIEKIEGEERILEIAKMISGKKGISETTLMTAKEMLQ